MKEFLKRHWFFLTLIALIGLAFWQPAWGRKLRDWGILKSVIFGAFLITGLTLRTGQIVAEIRNFRGLAGSILSSLVVIPLIAFGLARLFFPNDPGFVVGACILGAAPVTVASGTILTAVARGNVPLSLFICVATNLVAILSMPAALNLLLRFDQAIRLDVKEMILSLVWVILAPTVIGQIFRPWLRRITETRACRGAFSLFAYWVVLLIIYNAVASSADRIAGLGWGLALVFGYAVLLHAVMLGLNYAVARLLRLDRGGRIAFTIHNSQKTLTISSVVWQDYFAAAFPAAMIPAIAHHLTQTVLDTIVARTWGEHAADPLPSETSAA